MYRLSNNLTVAMIMTSRQQWVTASPTESIEIALERMASRFDQLPVVDSDIVMGVLFKADCCGVPGDAPVAEYMRAVDDVATMDGIDEGLDVAVTRLSQESCVLVRGADGIIAGLLHYSDLNKHAMRSFFYIWLSALEMSLARLVDRSGPKFEEWLGQLEETRQAIVLGRYEIERRKGIELSPVEGAELSDLLKVTKAFSSLLDALGLTKSQFDKKTGHLIKLRNAAMHPVRSLVQSHKDVSTLATRFADLEKLVRMLATVGVKATP